MFPPVCTGPRAHRQPLDPNIGIRWPIDADQLVLSDRDAAAPLLDEVAAAGVLPSWSETRRRSSGTSGLPPASCVCRRRYGGYAMSIVSLHRTPVEGHFYELTDPALHRRQLRAATSPAPGQPTSSTPAQARSRLRSCSPRPPTSTPPSILGGGPKDLGCMESATSRTSHDEVHRAGHATPTNSPNCCPSSTARPSPARGDIQRGIEVIEFAIGIPTCSRGIHRRRRHRHRRLLDPPAARRRRHHPFNFPP